MKVCSQDLYTLKNNIRHYINDRYQLTKKLSTSAKNKKLTNMSQASNFNSIEYNLLLYIILFFFITIILVLSSVTIGGSPFPPTYEQPVAIIEVDRTCSSIATPFSFSGLNSYIPTGYGPTKTDELNTTNDIQTPIASSNIKPKGFVQSDQTNIGANASSFEHYSYFNLSDDLASEQIIEYKWDFGDGTKRSGSDQTYAYNSIGTYIITLTIQTNKGKTAFDTYSLVVNPPRVTGVEIADPCTGDSLILSWNPITDCKIDHYYIYRSDKPYPYISADTTFVDDNLEIDTIYQYSISAVGRVNTTLYEGEKSPPARCMPTLGNSPPIVDAGGPYFTWTDIPITFESIGCYDIDGTIITYHWEFGDGQASNGQNVEHIYTSPGTYTVTLSVTDNEDATAYDTTYIEVVQKNNPPVAYANGPYFGYVNRNISFIGSNSSDSDGYITKYYWDFGDGTTSTEISPKHIYHQPGSYIVTLTVTDDKDGKDTNSTNIIVIHNRQPYTPDINFAYSEELDKYIFSIVAYDPDNDQIQYYIDWDDDNFMESPFFPSGTTLRLSYAWSSPGLYILNIVAKDEYNSTSEPARVTVIFEGLNLEVMYSNIEEVNRDINSTNPDIPGEIHTVFDSYFSSVIEKLTSEESLPIRLALLFICIEILTIFFIIYGIKRFRK